MVEKYNLVQAQDEAYDIRDRALELKLKRGEDDEPSSEDYKKAERLLEMDRESQGVADSEKIEVIRRKFITQENGEVSYRENTKRYASEVEPYIENHVLDKVPELYRAEYGVILQKQFETLEKNPIDENCRLSLVLPAYREEKVIIETLESLEKQTGIEPSEFEVIVVVNYPTGERPNINDYDENGARLGEHPDRTMQLVDEFSKRSKIKILKIEQDFLRIHINKKGEKENLAGVGIASKLGMDIALMRQRNNPQIIGYYGADTIFDAHWVKECFDGYAMGDVDAIRGRQERARIDNRVEDENGLHILTEEELARIIDFETRRYKYYHKLKIAINDKAVIEGRDIKKEAHGVATQTAGMYAHIGGMNVKTGGEDIANAQTISESGRIMGNNKMLAAAIGRIEIPRTEGGSYTRGLWNMYRAFQYGEGNLIDDEGGLLVDTPDDYRARETAISEIQKSLNEFHRVGAIDGTIERYFTPDEISVMQEVKNKSNEYKVFLDSITALLGENFWKKFNRMHRVSRIKIEDAEDRLKEIL